MSSVLEAPVVVGITGVSGGIGRALKIACEDRGYMVVGFSRRPDRNHTRLDLRENPSQVLPVIAHTVGRVGAFTAWVNLAGVDVLSEPLRSMPYEAKLQELWEVDVLGSVRCCQGVLPHLTADGCVINMGWDEAFSGHRGVSGELYALTKAAVTAYSKSLAKSLSGTTKKIFIFAPGWVSTRWHERLTNEQRDKYKQYMATGTWQSPQQIGEAIADLITRRAHLDTGSVHVLGPLP